MRAPQPPRILYKRHPKTKRFITSPSQEGWSDESTYYTKFSVRGKLIVYSCCTSDRELALRRATAFWKAEWAPSRKAVAETKGLAIAPRIKLSAGFRELMRVAAFLKLPKEITRPNARFIELAHDLKSLSLLEEELGKAWRRATRKLHPDKGGSAKIFSQWSHRVECVRGFLRKAKSALSSKGQTRRSQARRRLFLDSYSLVDVDAQCGLARGMTRKICSDFFNAEASIRSKVLAVAAVLGVDLPIVRNCV